MPKASTTTAINPLAEEAQHIIDTLPPPPVVIDQPSMVAANGWLREVKVRFNRVEALRKSVTQPLDDAKRAAQALFKPHLDELTRLEGELKRAIINYQRIENDRIARQRAEQQAAVAKAEREAQAEAELLEAMGEGEKATEVILNAAVVASATVEVDEAPRVEGFSIRTTYRAVVEDFPAFAAWCVSTGALHYLQADQKTLDANARGRKAAGPLLPGVVVVEEQGGVVR